MLGMTKALLTKQVGKRPFCDMHNAAILNWRRGYSSGGRLLAECCILHTRNLLLCVLKSQN